MVNAPKLLRRTAAGMALAAIAVTAGLGASSASAALPAFPTHGRFEYQINGVFTPNTDTKIVTRDVTTPSVSGRFNVCYINAFQTQPGESSQWSSNLLLKNKQGKNLIDPDWPDEYLLDTTTDAKRQGILAKQKALIDTCASKGYQAVEPDNLDTYSRDYVKQNAATPPTLANNIALLKLLADYAHGKNLLIAQKNAAQDTAYIKQNGSTDFAVAEECQRYTECDTYRSAYGAKVIEIEYNDYEEQNPTTVFNTACSARGATISVIQRDRDVVAKGRAGYVYKFCSNG